MFYCALEHIIKFFIQFQRIISNKKIDLWISLYKISAPGTGVKNVQKYRHTEDSAHDARTVRAMYIDGRHTVRARCSKWTKIAAGTFHTRESTNRHHSFTKLGDTWLILKSPDKIDLYCEN